MGGPRERCWASGAHDETIQAIAACALLHRLGLAQRVLVVTPASLNTEWEEQVQRFTPLPYQVVFGNRHRRVASYREDAPFFTIVNYEQMLQDMLDVNERLRPQVVVLDEAQRIKNWNTKTAQAIERLRSRYAFVLTGTPIENRIDELHSLMDFLDPAVLGPLIRFNRDFYQLDERGKPEGYRQLDVLHERIRPYLLCRRKAEVETELPARTDSNRFVPMSAEQMDTYSSHETQVMRLISIVQRRPLKPPDLKPRCCLRWRSTLAMAWQCCAFSPRRRTPGGKKLPPRWRSPDSRVRSMQGASRRPRRDPHASTRGPRESPFARPHTGNPR